MSEFDDRIRQSLARQARSLPDRTDVDGLTDRIARRHRRQLRVVAATLVLALVAGPVGGFLAGRDAAPAESDVATGAGGGQVTVEESSGPLPTIEVGGSGVGEPLPTIEGAPSALLTLSPRLMAESLAKSFVREVDGTTIRVYRAAVDTPAVEGPSWQQRPPWCSPTGYVQADVSTADVVGFASGSLYPELPEGSVDGSLGAIGVAEGAPLWVVVAQAPAGAARVRATFPDGHSDEMEPIDGVVVLVGSARLEPGDPAEYETTLPLEAFDEDGRSLGTGVAGIGWEQYGAECHAEPELPPPGAEQPADPAAARAEIEQLYGVRFSDRTDDERLAGIDDPTGMREVFEELVNGPFREQALASRTVLDDLVFLSATRAAVKYHVEIPDYPSGGFNGRLGEVVLVDGQWKLTRETVCRDVQLAAVTCP
jgi:hypothetical protein